MLFDAGAITRLGTVEAGTTTLDWARKIRPSGAWNRVRVTSDWLRGRSLTTVISPEAFSPPSLRPVAVTCRLTFLVTAIGLAGMTLASASTAGASDENVSGTSALTGVVLGVTTTVALGRTIAAAAAPDSRTTKATAATIFHGSLDLGLAAAAFSRTSLLAAAFLPPTFGNFTLGRVTPASISRADFRLDFGLAERAESDDGPADWG